MSSEILTIDDVSDHLGVSENTLDQWHTKGYSDSAGASASTSAAGPKTSTLGSNSKGWHNGKANASSRNLSVERGGSRASTSPKRQ